MKKIGAHVSSSGGIKNAIKNTQEIGGNCMQIFAGSPRMWKRRLYEKEEVAEFREQMDALDLDPIFIHALYLTNLASDKPELREKSRNALITDMTNSAAIKSAGVVLHIGSHQGRGFDAVKELVVKEIQTVLENTPKDSILLLENTAGQKGKIGTPEELQYLLTELNSDRVYVCIDTAHAFEAGYAIHTKKGLEEFVQMIESTVGWDRVKVLHLNDSHTEFDSHRDMHDNLGEGYIGIDAIKRIANHPKISPLPIILEVPGFDGDGPDAKNIQVIQKLVAE